MRSRRRIWGLQVRALPGAPAREDFKGGRQVDNAGAPFLFGDQITFQLSSKNTGAPRPDTIAGARIAPARLPGTLFARVLR
jgi:hypothetical protein